MANETDAKPVRWKVHRINRGLGEPTPVETLEQILNGLPDAWEPHTLTTDDKGGIIVVVRKVG